MFWFRGFQAVATCSIDFGNSSPPQPIDYLKGVRPPFSVSNARNRRFGRAEMSRFWRGEWRIFRFFLCSNVPKALI